MYKIRLQLLSLFSSDGRLRPSAASALRPSTAAVREVSTRSHPTSQTDQERASNPPRTDQGQRGCTLVRDSLCAPSWSRRSSTRVNYRRVGTTIRKKKRWTTEEWGISELDREWIIMHQQRAFIVNQNCHERWKEQQPKKVSPRWW